MESLLPLVMVDAGVLWVYPHEDGGRLLALVKEPAEMRDAPESCVYT